MKKKIYISGCGGMLGEAFYHEFKGDYDLKCTDKNVNDSWLSHLDITEFREYQKDVIDFKPDYLFHLGALADIEYCNQHPFETYKVNTIAVESAVHIANLLNIPLLYISTAGIFDGAKEVYDDWDMPNPLDVYARSKYLGERFVVENTTHYYVCRAGWMVGGGPRKDKKFVQKIMRQLKDGKKELFIVNDEKGTISYTHDFAKNVKLLIQSGWYGVYNMACFGQTSRIEIARELLKILDMDNDITITEVTAEFFKDYYISPRPMNESIKNLRLSLRGIDIMRPWKIALTEYITTYYKNYL